MIELTDEQVRFLSHHKIAPSAVLDARGMRRSEYQVELKRQNKAVALVAVTCGKNHTTCLRLSSGHCMECSPQGIAHWRRNQEPGIIYIATSQGLNCRKIGISSLPSDRADHLNKDGYGGATDWVILYWRKFDKAGPVEDAVHASLKPYRVSMSYERLAHRTSVKASELFSCDYVTAREAVESLADHALGPAWERTSG
jgi:hypothetical protein